MRPPESGQVDERFDARMMAMGDRRVQQPPGSIASAVQQLVECRCGDRIRGQACVGLTDRAVGLLPVMPNETFSRRHDVLPSFQSLNLQMSTAPESRDRS
jgi:hypothetical protein